MNNQAFNQFGQGTQAVVMENYYIIDSYYQSFTDIPQAKIIEVFNFLRTPFKFEELKDNHKGNYSVIPTYCRQRLYQAFLPVNISEEYGEYKLNGGNMYCTCTITVCGVQFTGVGGAKLNVKTAEGAVTYDHNTLKSVQSSAFKDACKRLGMPTSSEDISLVIKGVRSKQQAYKPNNQPVNQEQYDNKNNSQEPNFEQMNVQKNIVQMPSQNNQNNSVPCSDCGYEITSKNVIQKSTEIHGKPLCWNCQQKKKAN